MSVINICFHGIGSPQRSLEPGEDRYWISRTMFARILDEVGERPDVVLSFDDGNASDIEIGLGTLLQHGRTASFFVLAGRMSQAGSLGAADLQELLRNGMTIGTHGMDHVPWRFLTSAQVDRELVEARDVISAAVDDLVVEAALPLGRYDRTVLSHLRRLGYRRVYSSDRQRANPNAWFQARYSVQAADTLESVRSTILAPPSLLNVIRGSAAGLAKRLR